MVRANIPRPICTRRKAATKRDRHAAMDVKVNVGIVAGSGSVPEMTFRTSSATQKQGLLMLFGSAPTLVLSRFASVPAVRIMVPVHQVSARY